MKPVIIGTRKSELALRQAGFVAEKLRGIAPERGVEIKKIITKGDKILDVPLAKIGGKGLFTKEPENALLDGTIDIAVHSLKDMPTSVPSGLKIAAFTERADPFDAFIGHCPFAKLPKGARIGTSSLRRQAQLLRIRPDLRIATLRGNVNTRLKKYDEGEFDGIVLAAAGLKRLGFGERITEVFPPEAMLPAAGQGILAIETRADDTATNALVAALNHEPSRLAATAERAFLNCAGGGCQVPVGAYAEVTETEVTLVALIAALDGGEMYRGEITVPKQNAAEGGEKLAARLKERGGEKILKNILGDR